MMMETTSNQKPMKKLKNMKLTLVSTQEIKFHLCKNMDSNGCRMLLHAGDTVIYDYKMLVNTDLVFWLD